MAARAGLARRPVTVPAASKATARGRMVRQLADAVWSELPRRTPAWPTCDPSRPGAEPCRPRAFAYLFACACIRASNSPPSIPSGKPA